MSNNSDQPTESIVFSGKIGAVVHATQPDGRIFEQYRRPPGVRLVVVSPDNKILITKEHRQETGGVDLRLPGGKVCDTFDAWQKLITSGEDITQAAKKAAINEGLQETGLVIKEAEFIVKANAGATVEWDLYYFLVRNYTEHPDGQALEQGENIEVTWMTMDDIRTAIIAGQMQEWRSVGVLLGKVLPTI